VETVDIIHKVFHTIFQLDIDDISIKSFLPKPSSNSATATTVANDLAGMDGFQNGQECSILFISVFVFLLHSQMFGGNVLLCMLDSKSVENHIESRLVRIDSNDS
jgi:hypothetical protein